MKLLLLTLSLIRNLIFNTPVNSQEISLEPYCKNGYYEIAGEEKCSRAPNCGGYGYDELNTSSKMPSYDRCVGNSAPTGKNGCDGYVPLCCYEVARTGDFTKCIGYWERLWCTKSQCNTARANGASDAQCGGNCQCSHAHFEYCGNKEPVPLSQRLNSSTPQPTSANPTPTTPIQPTQPPINCPTSSARSYNSLSVTNTGDNRAAQDHADKNIHLRGYRSTNGTRNLIHNNGPKDDKAPQLSTVLTNNKPAIVALYQVYDWNWSNNTKGSALTSPWDVTMLGLSANPGDDVRVPDSGYSIGDGYEAIVLYAASDTITLEYTREDSVAHGYAIQYDGICVDPNLVNLYNQLNSQGRSKLPALTGRQTIGSARNSEVKVAVRDTGSYMDPRSDDSWWIGIGSLPNAPAITTTTSPIVTTLPNPTAVPTSTPAACTPPLAVTFSAPASSISAGSYDIAWTNVPNAIKYHLRVDDASNGWVGDCTKLQNSGDACVDNMTTTSYKHNFIAGHTYHVWVHAVNQCGGWDKASALEIKVINSLTTCTIQGYKQTTSNSSNVDTDSGIGNRKITVGSQTSTLNPYNIVVPGDTVYSVNVEPLAGYSVLSTYCTNRSNCHAMTDISERDGTVRSDVFCPAGGYADLWWHFTPLNPSAIPTPTPTISLAPGQCLGVQHCAFRSSTYFEYCGDCKGMGCSGQGYACRDPRYTCKTYPKKVFYDDVTYAVPCDRLGQTPPLEAPLTCQPPSDIRFITSLDRTRVSETVDKINIQWQKTTDTFIKIEISTDNENTWQTKFSGDEEYTTNEFTGFVNNASDKKIFVRVSTGNACHERGKTAVASADPAGDVINASPTTPVRTNQPLSRELIIGGSLLAVLLVAAFFVGA